MRNFRLVRTRRHLGGPVAGHVSISRVADNRSIYFYDQEVSSLEVIRPFSFQRFNAHLTEFHTLDTRAMADDFGRMSTTNVDVC